MLAFSENIKYSFMKFYERYNSGMLNLSLKRVKGVISELFHRVHLVREKQSKGDEFSI